MDSFVSGIHDDDKCGVPRNVTRREKKKKRKKDAR
jgi:hypothetical protein